MTLALPPGLHSWIIAHMLQRSKATLTALAAVLASLAYSLTASQLVACARKQSDAESLKMLQREVIEVLRQRFAQHSFKPTDDGLALVMEDGTLLGLTNLRAKLDAAPQTAEARRAVITTHFADVLAQRANVDRIDWAAAKPLIRPMLISREHPHAKTSLTRAFAADIVLSFVIDRPTSMMYVTEDMRKEWNCSIDELHSVAVANLDAFSANDSLQVSEPTRVGGTGRLLVFGTGDGYAAARLASPAFRRRLTAALGESFVTGIPIATSWSPGRKTIPIRQNWQRASRTTCGSIRIPSPRPCSS